MNSHVLKYRQLNVSTSIEAASPHQLIDLLMQGAQDRINQAKGAITRHDLATKTTAVNACIDIIEGLQASLDHEQGGELAANLDGLYDYMQRRLFRANADNDISALVEVADLLTTIKSAWVQIDPSLQVSAG